MKRLMTGLVALLVGVSLGYGQGADPTADLAIKIIQRGLDHPQQIQKLRVKGDAVIGGDLALTGGLTVSGILDVQDSIQSGACTNGEVISFTPAFANTPIVVGTLQGVPSTNNYGYGTIYVESASKTSFVLQSTVATTNPIHWVAVDVK